MNNTFQGAALFSAEEIKVALGNAESRIIELDNEFSVLCHEEGYYYDLGLFKKDKVFISYYSSAISFIKDGDINNERIHIANYLYHSSGYHKSNCNSVYERIYGIKKIKDQLTKLSSNGSRPAYLNPKQAAFVNEWGGDKNERD